MQGIHKPLGNSPLKGQWRGDLMCSLICAWTNGWVNNRDTTADLRRHRAHYDVTVMKKTSHGTGSSFLGIFRPQYRSDLLEGLKMGPKNQSLFSHRSAAGTLWKINKTLNTSNFSVEPGQVWSCCKSSVVMWRGDTARSSCKLKLVSHRFECDYDVWHIFPANEKWPPGPLFTTLRWRQNRHDCVSNH